jgi:hypothetical protein
MSESLTQTHFQLNDWVEVRPYADILATLDAQGRCEGLPFMPEMVQFCGRRFRVYRRAEKVFLDRRSTVVRLKNMVFLEGVRCNGQSHGGCEIGCLMFWKEAWLRPVDSDKSDSLPIAPGANAIADFPTKIENRYCCQATELVSGAQILPWWDVRQYLRDYSARSISVKELTGMLALLVYNKLRRACGLIEHGRVLGRLEKTVKYSLNLQPGELVQVKSREEIEATLDTLGRNRGLGFSPEMASLCNGRFRVLRRAERLIAEWSGEMHEITNTVILEDVTCNGLSRRCCPRDCSISGEKFGSNASSNRTGNPPRRRAKISS